MQDAAFGSAEVRPADTGRAQPNVNARDCSADPLGGGVFMQVSGAELGDGDALQSQSKQRSQVRFNKTAPFVQDQIAALVVEFMRQDCTDRFFDRYLAEFHRSHPVSHRDDLRQNADGDLFRRARPYVNADRRTNPRDELVAQARLFQASHTLSMSAAAA